MRVVFFGTSSFAVPALDALAGSRHELPAAVCPPPAPAGRGRRLVPCPVEARARERGIPVLDPGDPNDPGFLDQLAELEPDACLLASYGSILGPSLLELPKHGFINIHPSLLPRYRGAAPVLRCLLAGDTHTGVCVIRLTGQVDAGPVLARRKTAVGLDEDRGELEARLAVLGAELAVDVLDQLEAGTAQPRSQEDAGATPAPKLRPAERRLDWARSARRLHDQVRALAPEPGAWAMLRQRRLLVRRTRRVDDTVPAQPGELLLGRPGLVVGTGDGLIELVEVKPESGRTQSGCDLRNGLRLAPGERLE